MLEKVLKKLLKCSKEEIFFCGLRILRYWVSTAARSGESCRWVLLRG